jgi:RNA polymerase sigma-70 factor (ECF subfamily)
MLMPDEPEAIGLLALMLLNESRRLTRVAADGSLVRLTDQDRTQWDRSLINEGHDLVRTCLDRNKPGPFQIQAAISAVHADAPTFEATAWHQIISLYDELYALRPNPVVALNRSVAIAELGGAAEGLAALAEIDPVTLANYQPYHATRADFLKRAGHLEEAIVVYDRAIELTSNSVERNFLIRQRADL